MRRLFSNLIGFAGLCCLACPAMGSSQARPTQVATDGKALDAEIGHFYVARADAPLWFGAAAGDAPDQLIRLLETAKADGIDPASFDIATLLLAIRKAESGDVAAIERAEPLLSRAYVNYARGVQRDPKVGVIYVDAGLNPAPKPASILLDQLRRAPSRAAFVRDLGWMNPLYGQLRAALVQHAAADPATRHQLALNLERARALPPASERYLIVNAANQKLTMYEHGKPVGEMKIGVGRVDAQTPLMNAFVRYAVLNPYWNVPSDLVARMAPKVLRSGKRYLDQQGYEVVTGFDDGARIVDPSTVDWQAVAAGKVVVSMRQKPGPANSMGKVKFMFPNTQGVWLHDTPSREHFAKDVRLVSSGCVRLEDAWRLGSWLFGRQLRPSGNEPERRLELGVPVPIYITYLTAIPEGPSVRFIADVYQRDLPPIAAP